MENAKTVLSFAKNGNTVGYTHILNLYARWLSTFFLPTGAKGKSGKMCMKKKNKKTKETNESKAGKKEEENIKRLNEG